MGNPDQPLTVRETVLLILDATGDAAIGRTAAQKLAYFSAATLNLDLGHGPHYYGPYSRPVEAALGNSAFAGDLTETILPFSSGRGAAYEYRLTDQGRQVVAALRVDHPNEAGRIDALVSQLGQLIPGYHQHQLSIAAKVDLIVARQDKPISTAEVPALAKGLGWDVSDEDVTAAAATLEELGRVTRVVPS